MWYGGLLILLVPRTLELSSFLTRKAQDHNSTKHKTHMFICSGKLVGHLCIYQRQLLRKNPPNEDGNGRVIVFAIAWIIFRSLNAASVVCFFLAK